MPVELSSLRNRLLLALPTPTLELMLPHLHRVEMPFRSSVLLPNTSIDSVYFPESGWVSLLVALENGDAAEIGLVGREGMIGVPLLFGTDQSIAEAMVQCGGMALAMEVGIFRRLIADQDALRDLLLRYAFALNTQVAMTAACNGRHLLDERLARWLLMSHDRVEGDDFPMTHEFLAMMLGVRRAGITTAAGVLQKAGLIRYEQGRIRVLDRPGLEAAACEGHRMATTEFHRLLGKPIFK